MKKVDQLIHAKWIITCEENNRVLENHSMAINEGKIVAILPQEEADQTFQANTSETFATHAVLPGLINSHTHLAMNLFRGLADDLELMDWLTNHIWPAEGKWVSDELVYDGSRLAIAEMIRGGITCFNDMYFFLGATARAAELAGIRAHIGLTVIDVPTAWAKTSEEYFAKGLEFYHQYKHHELITPTMAPHSTYTVSLENLQKVHDIAQEFHLRINIHLQEAPSEITNSMNRFNKRPLERLHSIGMVSPQIIAIHMTQINDSDMDLLQQTKPNIVHCPESNMKLVSGSCPVEKLMERGINVALGTDGAASNNDLDLFGEMRTGAFLGKIVANNPKALPAATMLKMATINGAKALGIDHETGSLQSGKAADFIAINLDHIDTQPVYEPISQIVYATGRHQVSDVWVAGKRLLKNRLLQTLDEQELLAKAKEWRMKIKKN